MFNSKSKTKNIIIGTVLFIILSILVLASWYFIKIKSKPQYTAFHIPENQLEASTINRCKTKALNIASFAKANQYNTSICFLVDMSIPSGKERFFVYDIEHQKILLAGLVAHGSGKNRLSKNIQFSNVPNSNCSSLGKYKIGSFYVGDFGDAFKLHGLDITNSNAFDRFVVLHAHSCVANNATYPLPICESQGCPTVSPDFLKELKKMINDSKLPILLEIYN